jgi:hypothetical protein
MSATFPPEVAPAQSMNAIKLRDLDTFEEFFWLLEQSVPLFHTVVAEVNGTTTIEQWKDALDAIQIRYPLLSASIRKTLGNRPFLEKVQGVLMPLRIAPLTDSMVLEEEMEKELQQSFGDGSGPLTRATLFHGPDRSVVILLRHTTAAWTENRICSSYRICWLLSQEKFWGSRLRRSPVWANCLGCRPPPSMERSWKEDRLLRKMGPR